MGPGEGAGVVDIGDNQAIVSKVSLTIIHQQFNHIKGLLQALVMTVDIVSGARPINLLNSCLDLEN